MSSDRQLVIQTLRHLTRDCIKAQAKRSVLRLRKKQEIAHYDARLARSERHIAELRNRIQRELTAHKDLLGMVNPDELDQN